MDDWLIDKVFAPVAGKLRDWGIDHLYIVKQMMLCGTTMLFGATAVDVKWSEMFLISWIFAGLVFALMLLIINADMTVLYLIRRNSQAVSYIRERNKTQRVLFMCVSAYLLLTIASFYDGIATLGYLIYVTAHFLMVTTLPPPKERKEDKRVRVLA